MRCDVDRWRRLGALFSLLTSLLESSFLDLHFTAFPHSVPLSPDTCTSSSSLSPAAVRVYGNRDNYLLSAFSACSSSASSAQLIATSSKNRSVGWIVQAIHESTDPVTITKVFQMCRVGDWNRSQASLTSPEALAALRELGTTNSALHAALAEEQPPTDDGDDATRTPTCMTSATSPYIS
ncbi:hypothetical protein B0H19DRAFT_1192972 [Mycena capillaripes]|nr:hypothetical protein B0H19DRAFT_1192972 [Mycena capillaripes]